MATDKKEENVTHNLWLVCGLIIVVVREEEWTISFGEDLSLLVLLVRDGLNCCLSYI